MGVLSRLMRSANVANPAAAVRHGFFYFFNYYIIVCFILIVIVFIFII